MMVMSIEAKKKSVSFLCFRYLDNYLKLWSEHTS
jgi:hypothetical protein